MSMIASAALAVLLAFSPSSLPQDPTKPTPAPAPAPAATPPTPAPAATPTPTPTGPAAARTAQNPPAGQTPPASDAKAAADAKTAQATPTTKQAGDFSSDQLEQIVAPIALYPDSLLAQILMSSTYPLEIVQAARWAQANPKLTGEKLETALQAQTWDPAVKGLCGIPEVLKKMNDNLDWTQDLGDAFLGQKKQVMEAVQVMRRKAKEAGNLKTSKEMTVTEQADQVIVIVSAQPEVVYVPTYYPTAVYGGWGYPYYYYPPMYPPYPAGGLMFGFAIGVAWGGCWGNCNWGGNDINIDIDRQNNFIDRTESGPKRDQVKQNARGNGGAGGGGWKHDASHRGGVGYSNSKVAQNYGGAAGQSRVSRDQALGKSGNRPSAGTGAGGAGGGANRGGAGVGASRPSTGARPSTGGSRPSTTGLGSGANSGSSSPSMDRAASSRGSTSRGSTGARGGGGGSRGGGGRR